MEGEMIIFPHHENEIAQGSCCSSAKYCNYWFHNGIVLVNKKKMSKSLGNVILVSDILKEINPNIIRLALMSAHYRQPLNWTDETLKYSTNIFEKIYSSLVIHDESSFEKDELFLELLCDDINTPNAIQYLIKQSKEVRTKDNLLPKFAYNCNTWHKPCQKVDKTLEDKINELIDQREGARKNKDFDTADKIRDEIEKMGIELKDTPDGVSWKIKSRKFNIYSV